MSRCSVKVSELASKQSAGRPSIVAGFALHSGDPAMDDESPGRTSHIVRRRDPASGAMEKCRCISRWHRGVRRQKDSTSAGQRLGTLRGARKISLAGFRDTTVSFGCLAASP